MGNIWFKTDLLYLASSLLNTAHFSNQNITKNTYRSENLRHSDCLSSYVLFWKILTFTLFWIVLEPPKLDIHYDSIWANLPKHLHPHLRAKLFKDDPEEALMNSAVTMFTSVIFVLIIAIGVPANLLTTALYWTNPEKKPMSPTHYFLINLSIVDLLRLLLGKFQQITLYLGRDSFTRTLVPWMKFNRSARRVP